MCKKQPVFLRLFCVEKIKSICHQVASVAGLAIVLFPPDMTVLELFSNKGIDRKNVV